MIIASWICIFFGGFLYLKLRKQYRASSNAKSLENMLTALLVLLVGIAITGQYFPPLEMAGDNLMSLNTPTLVIPALVALVMCIYTAKSLLHYEHEWAKIYPCAFFIIITAINVGVFMMLNGALDLKPSQYLLVQVKDKKFSAGDSRSCPSFNLILEELENPTRLLRLDAGPTIYHQVEYGSKLHLEIGAGLLGQPWVKSVRFD